MSFGFLFPPFSSLLTVITSESGVPDLQRRWGFGVEREVSRSPQDAEGRLVRNLVEGILLGFSLSPSLPFPSSFPLPPHLALLLLLPFSSSLQKLLLEETERGASQDCCCASEKAVVRACIAFLMSSSLSVSVRSYLSEQKTELAAAPFTPNPRRASPHSVSLTTFWVWVSPSTLLRKISYPPSALRVSGSQGFGGSPRGI